MNHCKCHQHCQYSFAVITKIIDHVNAYSSKTCSMTFKYRDSIVYRKYFTAINHDSDFTTIAQPYSYDVKKISY